MTAHIAIRPARPETDLPDITRLQNAYEYQPVTLEDVRSWFRDYSAPAYKTLRAVSLDENGTITGYIRIIHDLSNPDGYFRVWLCVDPARCHQGIGSALWDAALDYLHTQGATQLTSEVHDNDPEALRFAEQRGFSIEHHLYCSMLDLTTFDASSYQPTITALESVSIRFCSFADFPDTPENRHKLWDLNEMNYLDTPNSNGYRTIYAEFEKFIFNAPWFKPEGQLLAVDGENWVGLCAINVDTETQKAYNLNTGVLRAYRGRKIAQALKVRAALYAIRQGARLLITDNDSLNAPMLAINRKLGYQPQPGHFMLVHGL